MRLPIPLRLLLAAQLKLVTPVLQVVHRVITRHLLGQSGLKADEADSDAVTLIQRFGSAANLDAPLAALDIDSLGTVELLTLADVVRTIDRLVAQPRAQPPTGPVVTTVMPVLKVS